MAFSGGYEFERTIEALFSVAGTTVVKTTPPVRVISKGKGGFRGVFLTKGALDFEGGYKGFFCGYDAKTCAGRRFSMRRVEGHQLDRMKAVVDDGGMAGAIVQFEKDETRAEFICLIPYRTLAALQAEGEPSLYVDAALHLANDELENRVYQLDPYNYDLFEAVLAQELARTMVARRLIQG